MEDGFILYVPYQGEMLELDAKLLMYGYIHRIEVNVEGTPVLFEPDEERNYRALVTPEQLESKSNKLAYNLLKAIAEQLEALPG